MTLRALPFLAFGLGCSADRRPPSDKEATPTDSAAAVGTADSGAALDTSAPPIDDCDVARAEHGVFSAWDGGPAWATQQPVVDETPRRGAGLAVVDLTGDGVLDVFLPNGSACQLFRGLSDGTFEDISATHLPDPSAPCGAWGVGAADIDGDDDLDLLLTGWGAPSKVWTNQGDGSFKDTTSSSGLNRSSVHGRSASFADIDQDGDLDAFVATHIHRDDGVVTHNELYENRRGELVDVSEDVLPDSARASVTFLGAFVDLDADLDLDLMLINDFGGLYAPNQVLENASTPGAGIAFVDRTATSSLAVSGLVMGVAVTDLNADGAPDFAMSDIERLHLYLSDGDTWYDAALSRGLEPAPARVQNVGWGVVFADVDNDGLDDVLVPYGPFEALEGGEVAESNQPDGLWQQQPDGTFVDMGPAWGMDHTIEGRGTLAIDLDGDGWLDVFKRDHRGGPALLLKGRPGCNRSVSVQLHGADGRRQAIGARVVVEAGDQRWTRWNLPTNVGLGSTGPSVVHVGIGRREAIDRVTVTWPSGAESVVEDPSLDGPVRVRER